MDQHWPLATSPVSLSWFDDPRQCQKGPGEPSVDCMCFALVWPHRRGIWGQGVKTRLCARDACMMLASIDLWRRFRCRCHGLAAHSSTKWALESQVWIACVLPWFGVETERSGAEVPVRRVMPGEREQEPRCWAIHRAEQSGEIAAIRRKFGCCLKGLTRLCMT